MTGVTALCHFDLEDNASEILNTMVSTMGKVAGVKYPDAEPLKTVEISIVGGYEDENDTSSKLSQNLLRDLITSQTNFILGLCCIGYLNTTFKVSPQRY